MDVGVLDCGEWDDRELSSETWREIYDAARSQGYDVPPKDHTKGGDNSPAEATADGGTEAATAAVTDPSPDDTAEDGDETDPWSSVRAIYEDDEEPNSMAHSLAVNLVLDELPVFTARETDRIYAYDHETGYYHEHGSPEVKRHLVDLLGHAYRTNREREILARVRGKTYAPIRDVGPPNGLLCVANGVLDLRDLPGGEIELLEHDPEYQFLTGLPVEYDPDADCPRFRELVNDVVNDRHVETLQEYAGYCLRPWDATFKRAAVCLGPKDSGKSTVLNVVAAMLGDERNVSNQNLYALMNTRWGTAQLHGKMANITNELGTQALKNIGLWKTLTGGDRLVDAERKGEQKFQFRPTTKHMFATNELPPADGADDAFHERFLHILFPKEVPPEDRVRNLDRKIIDEELAGVLNWAIEGYRRLLSQDGFNDDPLVGEKRERWEAYGNSIGRFKHNCLRLTGSPEDVVVKAIGYDLYTAYCEYAGIDVESQTKVTQKLKEDKHINDARRKAHPDDKQRTAWVGATYNPDALDALDFDPGSKLDELRLADSDDEDDEDETTQSHNLGGFS
jgi:putative DNA primase/helicase